jgi:GrpB-like predicted nucleotidyltransferase (UPF0157 family)
MRHQPPMRGLNLYLNVRRLTHAGFRSTFWAHSSVMNGLSGIGHGANGMDEVEIIDYDPRWPLLFDEEAERLRAVLDPSLIVGVGDFGSTAVPGLSAKPIIDILIAVRSLASAQATVVEALRNLDYVYWADNPKKDRMFFVKGMPPFGSKRSHHVHVTEKDGGCGNACVQGLFARSSRGSRDLRAAQKTTCC